MSDVLKLKKLNTPIGSVDAEFKSALKEGDNEKAAELLACYRERIKTLLRMRLSSKLRARVDESDVMQEALVDASKKLDRFRAEDNASAYAWFRQFALIKLSELTRHHLRTDKRAVGKEAFNDRNHRNVSSTNWLANHLVGDYSTPSSAARRSELVKQVHEGLDSLDPMEKEILILRHFEGLSTSESAQVLGISKSGAGKRYLKAIESLRRLLDLLETDE